jgi:hypothetical protein
VPVPVAAPTPVPVASEASPAPAPQANRPSLLADFEIKDLGLVPLDDPAPLDRSNRRPVSRPPQAEEPEVFSIGRALDPQGGGLAPADDLDEFEEPSLLPEEAFEEAPGPVGAPPDPIGQMPLPVAAPADLAGQTSLPVADPVAGTIPLAADEIVIGRVVRKRKKRPGDEEPSPVKKSTRGLPIVNLGLGFHYLRLIVLVAALVILVVFLVTLTGAIMYLSQTLYGMSLVSAVLLRILLWVLPVLGITGSVLCLYVPSQSRSLPMIIISLCLDAIQFPFVVILMLVKTESTSFLVLTLVTLILSVAAWVLFMVFLAILCWYLEEENMAYDAYRLIRKGLTLLGCYLLTQVIFRLIVAALFPAGKEMAADGLFLWWIMFMLIVQVTIVWVVIIIRFLFEIIALIGSIRQVILSRW